MVDQPRPVWLTESEVHFLDRASLRERWDAAPADATETAAKSIDAMLFARDGGSFTGLDCAETALRALGRPA